MRSMQEPATPGVWRWLRAGRDRLVTVSRLFAKLVITLPSRQTHERPHPWRGLLAATRRAFLRFPRFAHKLARRLAHDFRFRFFVDSDGQLQRVPAIGFAISSPGIGSKITRLSLDTSILVEFPPPGSPIPC